VREDELRLAGKRRSREWIRSDLAREEAQGQRSYVRQRTRTWVARCLLFNSSQKEGQSKALSTYDAAKASPQILAAERGAVGIAKPSIWEFVPCSRVINLASTCPAFIGYVRCAPVCCRASCTRGRGDQVGISSCRLLCWPDRLLVDI
jgi:hypothetical protein